MWAPTVSHRNSPESLRNLCNAGDKPTPRLELATRVISARSERIPRKKNGSQTQLDSTPDSLCDLLSRELFKN
ncbi:hypothetical protein RP20_CCG012566 [Aedes albopictus]|nr:hypothetical protein RP20_CCG012566 [Aedes albopictus]